MSRAAPLACCAALALALAVAPSAQAASHGTKTFRYTGSMETWTVPDGVEWLYMDAQGGHGGQEDHTARGGRAGGTSGAVRVTPETVLRIWVGQVGRGDGGWGWARGGEHGTAPGAHPNDNSGAGGGGASAIGTGSALFMVAGGGGGGGGDEDGGHYGGPGGDGGSPAGDGAPAKDSASYDGAGAGGCGGCAGRPDGDPGDNVGDADGGGAGGGGGGGHQGGVGAKTGRFGTQPFTGIGGGGGGGGSSWIADGLIDQTYYTSGRDCPPSQGSGNPQCNGAITLEWGAPPATTTATGGSGQHTPIGAQFETPLTVKVTDEHGVPVPDVTVTFSTPDGGPSGLFRDASTSLVRETRVRTDVNGGARVAGVVANAIPGTWTAEASVGAAVTPARFTLTNDPVATTTMVSSSVDPSLVGQPVRFTASVLADGVVADPQVRPTGFVQFFVDGAVHGDAVELDPARGTASLPELGDLRAGSHQIEALYQGDAGHLTSRATLTQRVERAHTALTLSLTPSPSDVGEQIVASASVAVQAPAHGAPTGTVQFAVDGSAEGIAPVPLAAGEADLAIPGGLPLGAHTVTAEYSGDDAFEPASGAAHQSVGPTATATLVSSSVNPSAYGEPLTLTATVRRKDPGLPVTGVISLSVDGESACPQQPVGGGENTVTCRLDGDLAPGAHVVEADFAASDPALADDSSGTLTQVVTPARTRTAVTVDPEPSTFGGTALLIAAVETLARGAGAPTGSVQFYVDGSAIGAPVQLADGTATISAACALTQSFCSLDIGGHAIEAEFVDGSAAPRFARSHGAVHHRVGPADTTTELSSSADPVQEGSSVTFTARISAPLAAGTPRGSVQFLIDGDTLGDPVGVQRGRAESGPVDRLAAGDHAVEARYLGATTFSSSAAGMTQRVTPQPGAPDTGGGPGGGQAGPSAAPPGRVRLLGTRARVNPQGTFRLHAACDGAAGARCAGRLTLRTGGKSAVVAWREVSLHAGRRASLAVDLARAGERMLSRKATLRVIARLPGTPAAERKLVLSSTRAPAMRAITRAARPDARGRVAVRVACRAPRAATCHGRLTLAGTGGRVLGARSVSLPGGATSTVRLRLRAGARRSGGARATLRAVSEIPVGRAAKIVTPIALVGR